MKQYSIHTVSLIFSIQIAADYAQQDYDDFAVVIQLFVSNTRSDKFSIDFLSDVSDYAFGYPTVGMYNYTKPPMILCTTHINTNTGFYTTHIL